MKALTVRPKEKNSAELRDVPEPQLKPSELLCEMQAIGICGTDREIINGDYGEAPAGQKFLILGHESLGRVIQAPENSKFKKGDLVVGFVRRPDPKPCPHCAVGEWDMCENDLYQERGIKGLNGYASERFALDQNYSLKIDTKLADVAVLLEPTSVVAKAWEYCEQFASRSKVQPKKALITGSGTVGLLAAMMARQKGLEVHVFDRAKEGLKPEMVKSLGGTYHSDLKTLEDAHIKFNFILECTGAPEIIFKLMNHISTDGILCLIGVSTTGHSFPTDVGALNLQMVLRNEVIFGSVNANRRHYEKAAEAISKADLGWLKKMITRRIPLSEWSRALDKVQNDIKTILIPG